MSSRRERKRMGSTLRHRALGALLALCLTAVTALAQQPQPVPHPSSETPDPETLLGRVWIQDETLSIPTMGGGSFLGVGVADVTAEMAEQLKMGEPRGVVVTSVSEGSPAGKAGVRVKDVLLSYNGTQLESGQQLKRMVAETPSGRTVRLQVLREGKTVELSAVTAARRAFSTVELERSLEKAREAAGRVWMVMPDIPRMLTVYRSASLGIDSEPLSPQLAAYFGVKEGALVREVEENSAAAKAGVKAGDVIVALEGQPVAKPADLSRILKEQKAVSAPLKLGLVRNQKELTLPVLPEEGIESGRGVRVRPAAPRAPRAIAIGNGPTN